MSKFFLILFILFVTRVSSAQTPGQWTWMNGDSASPAPVYGTKGVPSLTNKPPALYEAVEWTDTSGNFWLYGGGTNIGPQPEQADLWEFNPSTNEWMWVKGPGNITLNQLPVYGTKGVAALANTPGSRSWGVASWVDNNGDLWLFGGANTAGFFSDLWKYNIASNQWTWMSGPKTYYTAGIYGTRGVSNPGNNPGAREEVNVTWTDNAGNLWLFGGDGYDGAGQPGFLNDLWKYDVSLNQWTWMNGPVTGSDYGNHGTKGIASALNDPSGRWCYAKWKDKAGNFWMFGGYGLGYTYGLKNLGQMNDLWKYDVASNTWTWVSGTDSLFDNGSWGQSCILSLNNYPSGRFENRTCWTDACGNFWMFGGHSILGNDQNSLWYYNTTLNEWGWVGDTVSSSYGSKGLSSQSNIPHARGGGLAWIDKSGRLWMGEGWSIPANTYYNDLWCYVPDTSCNHCNNSVIPPVASFQSDDSDLCAYECINFTDLSAGSPTSWLWTFTGGMPSSSTLQNPMNVCYISAGTYDVKLLVSSNGGPGTVTYNNFITVHSAPPIPGIHQLADTLYINSDPGYSSYQWFYETNPISGATDSFHVATQNGNYNIKVTNKDGCSIGTGINVVLSRTVPFAVDGLPFTVYPNPVGKELRIRSERLRVNSIELYNILGMKVPGCKPETGKSETIINVSSLPPGVYIINIQNKDEKFVTKFIKD